LTTGLAPYWESNITSLDSGGRVRLAPLKPGGASANPYESDSAWFDPAVSRANFVVTVSSPPLDAALVTPDEVHAHLESPQLVFGLATAGGLVGLLATEHYADAGPDAGRRAPRLSFNPQSILLAAARTPGNHPLLTVRF